MCRDKHTRSRDENKCCMDELEILYSDDNVVFVSKPSGLLVHRTEMATDKDVLLQRVRNKLGRHVYPVHRLDRGASGIVGFGLSADAARELQQSLAEAGSVKKYYALVRGQTPPNFKVDRPLKNEVGVAQEAVTEFETVASSQYCSLVTASLKTGRYHQIRRHLSHLGHHILGDRNHGKSGLNNLYRDKYGLNRLFLHAYFLSFSYRGVEIKVNCPLPTELSSVIDGLIEDKVFVSGLLKTIGRE